MPDTDIDITALLLKLRSSNSQHNIAVNWLTTRRVQLQNPAACSVETSTSISPLELYSDIGIKISTEQAAPFCNLTRLVVNQFTAMLCQEFELRNFNSKAVMSMSVSGMGTSKTALLANFLSKYLARKVLKTLTTNSKPSLIYKST